MKLNYNYIGYDNEIPDTWIKNLPGDYLVYSSYYYELGIYTFNEMISLIYSGIGYNSNIYDIFNEDHEINTLFRKYRGRGKFKMIAREISRYYKVDYHLITDNIKSIFIDTILYEFTRIFEVSEISNLSFRMRILTILLYKCQVLNYDKNYIIKRIRSLKVSSDFQEELDRIVNILSNLGKWRILQLFNVFYDLGFRVDEILRTKKLSRKENVIFDCKI